MAYVYRHIRLDKNEVFYVGISSDSNPNRAKSNLNRNKYWHNIVNKTPIRIDILFDNITYNEAKEKEIEFISLYGRTDIGNGTLVNMTNGGEGVLGIVVSESTRKKISEKNTGKKQSEETKIKISLARKGFKHTDEVKRLIGEFKKGKKLPPRNPVTDETRKKISESKKGKSPSIVYLRTEEHKKRMSEGALGKKMSESAKKKMSDNQKLPILQYDLQGDFIKEWDGIVDASRSFGKHSSSIMRCCQGKTNKTYGFIWKYKYPDRFGRRKNKQSKLN